MLHAHRGMVLRDRSVLEAYISRSPPAILNGGRETFILTLFGRLMTTSACASRPRTLMVPFSLKPAGILMPAFGSSLPIGEYDDKNPLGNPLSAKGRGRRNLIQNAWRRVPIFVL